MAKNTQPDHVLTATHLGPKPADFPLGSVESRAAARAMVQQLAKEVPQEGDILLDLDASPGSVAIHRALGEPQSNTPAGGGKRIPGVPLIWNRFPEGFDPDSVPESDPPATMDDIPLDVLLYIVRLENKPPAERYVKISGGAVVKSAQIVSATPTDSQEAGSV